MLDCVGFPKGFRDLIVICVRAPTFSIMMNGASTGFFGA